ncbi:hypothetical protein PPL_06018 [Heterostelium album PN500]|uniref:F-box domain-containing protein n=1 Tax=Heterostelium pallidum (strain ATCC 26659 / Pp 5 / PN500) TaxID=670386 RepID=D3BBZ8_HETP5|nr:hypothetical protein PPL_06018 [Heterostelium album PN500]EFA81181.1 hypothetical protein PPL_06018 [Heterostelium album PN500]|eukprot:XP_020433299.1 hypothetical protein PPL_06018 [Heterostelium album PN500]
MIGEIDSNNNNNNKCKNVNLPNILQKLIIRYCWQSDPTVYQLKRRVFTLVCWRWFKEIAFYFDSLVMFYSDLSIITEFQQHLTSKYNIYNESYQNQQIQSIKLYNNVNRIEHYRTPTAQSNQIIQSFFQHLHPSLNLIKLFKSPLQEDLFNNIIQVLFNNNNSDNNNNNNENNIINNNIKKYSYFDMFHLGVDGLSVIYERLTDIKTFDSVSFNCLRISNQIVKFLKQHSTHLQQVKLKGMRTLPTNLFSKERALSYKCLTRLDLVWLNVSESFMEFLEELPALKILQFGMFITPYSETNKSLLDKRFARNGYTVASEILASCMQHMTKLRKFVIEYHMSVGSRYHYKPILDIIKQGKLKSLEYLSLCDVDSKELPEVLELYKLQPKLTELRLSLKENERTFLVKASIFPFIQQLKPKYDINYYSNRDITTFHCARHHQLSEY